MSTDVKNLANNIWRMNKSVHGLIDKETAEIRKIIDVFAKYGDSDVIEIEKGKSGILKTLKIRIGDKLNLIHTYSLRIFNEIGGSPFVTFALEDLTGEDFPDNIPKSKMKTAMKSAVAKKQTVARKAVEEAGLAVFSIVQWREFKKSLKSVSEVFIKRNITPVDLDTDIVTDDSPFTE